MELTQGFTCMLLLVAVYVDCRLIIWHQNDWKLHHDI